MISRQLISLQIRFINLNLDVCYYKYRDDVNSSWRNETIGRIETDYFFCSQRTTEPYKQMFTMSTCQQLFVFHLTVSALIHVRVHDTKKTLERSSLFNRRCCVRRGYYEICWLLISLRRTILKVATFGYSTFLSQLNGSLFGYNCDD